MKQKSGFTLIELSIVIVIIGLIIAGVSAGQMIVKQARIRTVITDLDKYKAAVGVFKTQYNALPGDMRNASSYWGSSNTNNGNGDGTVGSPGGENLYLWNHLWLAGLITGNYPKSNQTGGSIANFNVPGTYDGTVCIDLRPRSSTIGGVRMGSGRGSYLILGKQLLPDICKNAGFIPGDTLAIDTKIDDGNAATGLIQAVEGTDAGIANPGLYSCASLQGVYNTSYKTLQCILLNDRPW